MLTRLGKGSLDTLITNGGRYRPVFQSITEQRSLYDRQCRAAQLLNRDSLSRAEDFDCAVVMACAQYRQTGISEESEALFPSCIESSARSIAEQRQRTYAAPGRWTAESSEIRFGMQQTGGSNPWVGVEIGGQGWIAKIKESDPLIASRDVC